MCIYEYVCMYLETIHPSFSGLSQLGVVWYIQYMYVVCTKFWPGIVFPHCKITTDVLCCVWCLMS